MLAKASKLVQWFGLIALFYSVDMTQSSILSFDSAAERLTQTVGLEERPRNWLAMIFVPRMPFRATNSNVVRSNGKPSEIRFQKRATVIL